MNSRELARARQAKYRNSEKGKQNRREYDKKVYWADVDIARAKKRAKYNREYYKKRYREKHALGISFRDEAKKLGFKSGLERTLDALLKQSGVGHTYETLKLAYIIDHVYKPDFVLDNGIILEAKGVFRKNEQQKYKHVKIAHPDLDIRFVFQEPHRPIPGRKQTHADWATRHGFPWCDIKDVPKDWLQ